MGRWMEKIQNGAGTLPAKPTEPSYAGFAGAPSPCFQKKHAANDPLTPQQIGWLTAVAGFLECATNHLVEGGFIDSDDLNEQLAADPRQVAQLIQTDPRWHQ